jgi:hypothetical protein
MSKPGRGKEKEEKAGKPMRNCDEKSQNVEKTGPKALAAALRVEWSNL